MLVAATESHSTTLRFHVDFTFLVGKFVKTANGASGEGGISSSGRKGRRSEGTKRSRSQLAGSTRKVETLRGTLSRGQIAVLLRHVYQRERAFARLQVHGWPRVKTKSRRLDVGRAAYVHPLRSCKQRGFTRAPIS